MHVVFFFFLAVVAIYADEEEAVFQNPCDHPLKIAKAIKSSNTTGTLKYYFDGPMASCFPYRTNGGDDGDNSFPTEQECREHCLGADYFTCGGNVNSTGSCGYGPDAPECPKGSTCKSGGMVGICCPEETEKAFYAEYSPSCPADQSLVTQEVYFGQDTLRGRFCSHKFCPSGSDCHQGKWISYCCRK